MNRLLTFIFLLLLCANVNATTYYVDFASGNDANAGTSTSLAWQHPPGSTLATSTAASITVQPPDTVLFHGGVTYTLGSAEWITVPNESTYVGTSVLTYESGDRANPQWGTTPAFINCAASLAITNVFSMALCSNICFNGFVMANQPTNQTYGGFIGNDQRTGRTGGNITVNNCTFTNGGGAAIYIQGLFNLGANPSGFTFSNNYVEHMGNEGIFCRYGCDNILLVSNTLGNIGYDFTLFYYGGSDQFHGVSQIGNTWFGVSTNKGYTLFEGQFTGVTNLGNRTLNSTNQVAGYLFNGLMTNVLCANDLLNMSVAQFEGVYRFHSDIDPVFYENLAIVNNTIVANDANGALFYLTEGSATGTTLFHNLRIQNNIIDNSPGGSVSLMQMNLNSAKTALVVDMSTFTCDDNVWNPHSSSSVNGFFIGGTGESGSEGTNYTFAQWQSTFAKDANSTTAVPTYQVGTFIPANGDTVTANGANLIAYLSSDLRGVPRPVAGPWTIGAYQSFFLPQNPSLIITGSGQILVTSDGQIIVK